MLARVRRRFFLPLRTIELRLLCAHSGHSRTGVRILETDVRLAHRLMAGTDQKLTRASSRHLYGALLKYGIKIYEYGPSMNHTKALMVDDVWAVVGSTNFDYRSFSINDEVNLAVMDEAVTRRVAQDFRRDLAESKEITYEDWREKSRFRIADRLLSVFERQE